MSVNTELEKAVGVIEEDVENTPPGPSEIENTLPDLPEKFKNKSLEDIVSSYVELEKEYGRRNNEVGDLRKLTDQLLEVKLKQEEEPSDLESEIDPNDFYTDPVKSINAAIENNPRLQQLEQNIMQGNIDKARTNFESRNPDWKSVMGSQEFQEWVSESPRRTKWFQEADRNFDYDSGEELLTLFKEVKGGSMTESKDSDAALKAASVVKGGPAPTTRKVFRRADLIKLRITNPSKYDAMQSEIMQAYVEGRVK